MVRILVIIMMIKLVSALRMLPNQRRNVDRFGNDKNNVMLSKILSSLYETGHFKKSRRIDTIDHDIHSLLSKQSAKRRSKKILRDDDSEVIITTDPDRDVGKNEQAHHEQAVLVENELMDALNKQTSALLDTPYVEKKGRNDFLVMKPDVTDPFVTVIPNAIYYSIEKKCVNWLDDCSLQGIRARLLNKINSPYKK